MSRLTILIRLPLLAQCVRHCSAIEYRLSGVNLAVTPDIPDVAVGPNPEVERPILL